MNYTSLLPKSKAPKSGAIPITYALKFIGKVIVRSIKETNRTNVNFEPTDCLRREAEMPSPPSIER
jgi:hypothetical protein